MRVSLAEVYRHIVARGWLPPDTLQEISLGEQLLREAEHGNLQEVRNLLKRFKRNSPYVNLHDSYGNNALILAVRSGHTDVVRELRADGRINIHTENDYGYTAHKLAILGGHYGTARACV